MFALPQPHPTTPAPRFSDSLRGSASLLCELCCKILLTATSFEALLEVGLVFTRSLKDLKTAADRPCPVCNLLRWSLLHGEFTGCCGEEDFRFGTDLWRASSLSFTVCGKFRNDGGRHDLGFEVFVGEFGPLVFSTSSLEDDPASRLTDWRPIGYIERVKRWITECETKHKGCVKMSEGTLPTRVLDVSPQQDGDFSLRLYETNGGHGRYIALSYCWGEDQPERLMTGKFSAYCNEIDESTLPLVIRDAIHFTRALGVRFLWIDAYCILQDSREDKSIEISRMKQIYKGSFLTIAATKAKKVSTSFLKATADPSHIWVFPIRLPDGQTATFLLKKTPDFDLSDEPINKRAWTLQEHLLSSRVLSFPSKGLEISWQCDTVHQSDYGVIREPFGKGTRLYSSILPRQGDLPTHLAVHRLCYRWSSIIEDFCNRALTDPDDKLPAIEGIAQEFQRAFSGAYYAGLWGRFIHAQLLWRTNHTSVDPLTCITAGERYRAPTWSWASLDSQIHLPPEPYLCSDPKLHVIRCDVTLADEAAPFGKVLAGCLTVSGLLKEALVHFSDLLDKKSKMRLATVYMDSASRSGDYIAVWCLLVRSESDKDWELETRTSQTSLDYPGSTEGLCLVPIKDTTDSHQMFRRVGLFTYFVESSMDWFDNCVAQTLNLV